jgi:hypothetical protein
LFFSAPVQSDCSDTDADGESNKQERRETDPPNGRRTDKTETFLDRL